MSPIAGFEPRQDCHDVTVRVKAIARGSVRVSLRNVCMTD